MCWEGALGTIVNMILGIFSFQYVSTCSALFSVEDLTEVITPNPSATISVASELTDADLEQGKKCKKGSSKKMKRLRSFLRSLCCVKKESDNLENVAKPKAKKNDGKSNSNRGSAIGNLRKRFQKFFSLNAN